MASSSGPSKKAKEMRIILLGLIGSGKSSSGNIILDSEQFSLERTTQCEKRQGDVAGRHITVVDTPGWGFSSPNRTPNLIKQEIVLSASLCPPGPHAVLLVIDVIQSHTIGDYKNMWQHTNLLGPTVWSHTMILFTFGLGESIEQYIKSEGEGLQRLLEKCGNRYHVLDIENRGDVTQVTELLQKIEEMAGDKGGCFEIDRAVLEEAEKTEEKRRTQDEGATRRQMKVKKERESIRSRMGDDLHLSVMRIILLGCKASGRKSSSGNTILGSEQFSSGETDQCEKRQGDIAGRHITVVNTAGWFYNAPLNRTSELIKQQIVLSASLCPPGPHAVLLVISAIQSLQADECKNMEDHMQLLGPTVWSHTMILFTYVDWLRGKSIENFIESEGEVLQRLVEKCGNRYHLLDNENRGDGSQVTELLQKIEEMVAGNGGPATLTPAKQYKRQCVALYDYVSQREDLLELKVGDIIDYIGEVGPGWWKGILNGKEGLFPSNHVKELESSGEDKEPSDAAADKTAKSKALKPPVPAKPKAVTASVPAQSEGASSVPGSGQVEQLTALLKERERELREHASMFKEVLREIEKLREKVDKLENQRQMEADQKRDSANQQHPTHGEAAKKLKTVREQFVQRISEATLHSLLDKLLDKDVISDDEMEAAKGEKLRADKARYVIDTVKRKGDQASSIMIDIMIQLDRNLGDLLQR